MKTKTCITCKKRKSINSFSSKKYTKVDLSVSVYVNGDCKPCATRRIEGYRKKRKVAGLCIQCGIKISNGFMRCDSCLEKRRAYWLKRKTEVFEHYGGSVCSCCGEDHPQFLSIDHINGGGIKHRKSIGKSGSEIYHWLRRNGFPTGYRVLCMNCNCALGWYGKCPHKQ